MLREMLFHSPWWLWIGMGALGLFLVYTGNQRHERWISISGVAALILCLALALINYLVVTDTERCENLTTQLVDGAMAKNWDAVAALMDPHASFHVMGENDWGLYDRSQIIDSVKQEVGHYGVDSAHINSMDDSQDESMIDITASITTTQDATLDRPIPSTWQFQWRRDGNSWTLQRIILLSVGDRNGSEIYNPRRD